MVLLACSSSRRYQPRIRYMERLPFLSSSSAPTRTACKFQPSPRIRAHRRKTGMSRARHNMEKECRAKGGRINMVASGNPDVIKEAEGKEDYAKGNQRKRGGKVKGGMMAE